MSTKITAPVKTEGRVETYFGSRLVVFEDGEAEVEFELNDGLTAYLRGAGYGINGSKPKVADDGIVIADPRELEPVEQVGTSLRDAAVDPRATDFLPPINAGEANPHGGEVVAPGIHAIGPGPIVPGTVGGPEYQEAKESATAEAVLIENVPAPKVAAGLNGMARAEYALTKAEGRAKGLAQELGEGDQPGDGDYTAEERELLGLDDLDEDEVSDGDPAPEPEAQPSSIEEDLENQDPDADEGNPADENEPEEEEDEAVADAETLKGEALTQALKERELPLTGSADERRARVAEYDAQKG